MTRQSHLLSLILVAVSAFTVQSFVVTKSTTALPTSKTAPFSSPVTGDFSTTRLFVEEGEGVEAPSSGEGAEDAAEDSAPAPAASSETDILNSPAFLKRKIDVLKSDIAETEKETEEAQQRAEAGKVEWGPQLDDLRQEYKNIQERMALQNKGEDTEAVRAVVKEMLDFLDNFDRAFGVIKPESDVEFGIEAEYKEAYQMVIDTFNKLGVEEVQTIGSEFDYELHQAVMQKPTEEFEEGIVCEEFQKGFKIGDTLIRPAMVAVAV